MAKMALSILYLLTQLGAVLPAVPDATSHRGRKGSAFTALLWHKLGRDCKNTPRATSCVLLLSLFRYSLDHISSWSSLVLLISDELLIFFVPISKLLKGTTRKVTLFTLNADYQSSAAAVATVMLQCLITSSTTELKNLLVFHVDANFP